MDYLVARLNMKENNKFFFITYAKLGFRHTQEVKMNRNTVLKIW